MSEWYGLAEGLEWWGIALLLLAAFAAGWIDAVIGGGGLIQLPALLLMPGITPLQALATNKLGSVFGTATSSVTYYRKLKPNLRAVLPMAFVALLASIGGASLAAYLPAEVITPLIVIALIIVLLVTLFKPQLGAVTRMKHSEQRRLLTSLAVGLIIGAYDGLLGPGTGSFLVIALVGFIGLDFLRASVNAKIVNLATNLGALILFIPIGAVMWKLGLMLAAANALGGFLGARTAMARGIKFVRILFLIVVSVLIVKLGTDVLFPG